MPASVLVEIAVDVASMIFAYGQKILSDPAAYWIAPDQSYWLKPLSYRVSTLLDKKSYGSSVALDSL